MQPVAAPAAVDRSRPPRAWSALRRLGPIGAAREIGRLAPNTARLMLYRDVLRIRYYERKVHDYRLVLDLHDAGITRQLMRRGAREEEHAYILEKELKSGNVVLDLGANVGYYSVMMARAVGPTGRVYAAEPADSNFHLLSVNLRLNRVDEIVEAFNVGIGRESGRARFYLSALSNCHTFCPEGIADEIASHGERFVDVEVVGVVDFLDGKRHVDLLRMDIEGYEVEVLEGLTSSFATAPDRILFETHRSTYGNGCRMRAVLQTLLDYGYVTKWLAADCFFERGAADVYRRLGYESHLAEVFPAADRAVYRDIRAVDVVHLVTETDFVRAIMLQKTR